jgi:hypothetical protein
MDSEGKWIAITVMAIFGGLFGGMFYSEHVAHVEKMECMKLKGEYIGKGCVFREAKPQ